MSCSVGSRVDRNPANPRTQTDTAGMSPDMRQWKNLNHDLLVLIFSKLQLHDLINGGSRVCSSWRAAAMDPVCWCHILGANRSKLLHDIADCGSVTEFWHFLCGLYGGCSRDHSEMVDFIIRKKI